MGFRGSVMDEGDTSGARAGTQLVGIHSIVKFEPGPTSYEFVQQCSGRGLCNGDDGLCECFTGYTSDNCDQQSALPSRKGAPPPRPSDAPRSRGTMLRGPA